MKKFLLLGAVLPAMFLAGCGDEWDSKLYDGFPYGNARTAGHGIAYVRANMMPEKGPNLEASSPLYDIYNTPEPPPLKEVPLVEEDTSAAEALINSGEKFFRDMQRK